MRHVTDQQPAHDFAVILVLAAVAGAAAQAIGTFVEIGRAAG